MHDTDLTCPACLGTGRIGRPDLPTPEEQIEYTEMLEREDDIADDLARADEAAWRCGVPACCQTGRCANPEGCHMGENSDD